MSPRSRVTIRDVAAHAGVSHQTVSRVINDNDRVSPETRQRVEQSIRALGYRPNAIARFMASGRTYTLACFSPNLTDFTYASIIEGAEFQARRQGYFLFTASAPDEATFRRLVDELVVSRRTEGLLIINPYIDHRQDHMPGNIPAVLIGAQSERPQISSICLDEISAGMAATRHLLELGHTAIATITGPLNEDCSCERLEGHLRALRDAGIAPNPDLQREGDWSATSGDLAVQSLLNSGTQFSALFAQNDRMAVGAIRALRQAGKHVPGDVSVIGFDDMPLASHFDPPLTTIKQDMAAMGTNAVSLLIDHINSPSSENRQIRMPVELVIRQSTTLRR